MELDIDAISVPLLWKIHGLVMRYHPEVETQLKEQMRSDQAPSRPSAKPAQKKKNKPMSKTEQERRIESLTQQVEEFKRHGSGSQEPVMPSKINQRSTYAKDPRPANRYPAVETQDESSGDEESASEEE